MSDLTTITKKSWANVKKGFNLYFLIQIVFSGFTILIGIIAAVLAVIAAAIIPFFVDGINGQNDTLSTTYLIISIILVLLVVIGVFAGMLIISAVAQGAMIHAIDDVENKKELKDYKHYLKTGYEKKWPVLGLMIVQFFFIFLGFMLFIIPGLIVGFFLSLSIFPKVLKGSSIKDSLNESYELILENFWPTLGKYVLLMLAIWLASLAVGFIPFANFILQLFTVIAWSVVGYTIYMDLRKAKSA